MTWAAAAVAWLLLHRTLSGVPWGFGWAPDIGGLTTLPIMDNPGDTWSYLSWIQQYRRGHHLAEVLYTTDPHQNLLWTFPLWIIGRVAAVLSLEPFGVYNIATLVGAFLAVLGVRRAARASGLGPTGSNVATVGLLLGSGSSWVANGLRHLGFAASFGGAERIYCDLFPATAFIDYGYHALSWALLAWLWALILEFEHRSVRGEPARATLGWLAVGALFLGFSRPYEPISLVAVLLAKAAWDVWRPVSGISTRASLVLAGTTAAAVLPGIGMSVWVSRQPVWREFAGAAAALGLDRGTWLASFAGWIVLGAVGGWMALRAEPSRSRMPICASLLLVAVLVGVASGYAKLASGLLLGPILLAGWCWGRFPKGGGGRAMAGWAAVLMLLGVPSLAVVLNSQRVTRPHQVDTEVLELAGLIRPVAEEAAPVVLTDLRSAECLPGMAGVRVWVGHWGLSPGFGERVAGLTRAGLGRNLEPVDPAVAGDALDGILGSARFDYALIGRDRDVAGSALRARGWVPVRTLARWELLRPGPPPR